MEKGNRVLRNVVEYYYSKICSIERMGKEWAPDNADSRLRG
jgi:hypothetical protein